MTFWLFCQKSFKFQFNCHYGAITTECQLNAENYVNVYI